VKTRFFKGDACTNYAVNNNANGFTKKLLNPATYRRYFLF